MPNSLILDCFCGSGGFLQAGLAHKRRAIGIDISAVALQLTQERLQTLLV
ncbi:DNA methyltransferase [Helicobacter heilmannii]